MYFEFFDGDIYMKKFTKFLLSILFLSLAIKSYSLNDPYKFAEHSHHPDGTERMLWVPCVALIESQAAVSLSNSQKPFLKMVNPIDCPARIYSSSRLASNRNKRMSRYKLDKAWHTRIQASICSGVGMNARDMMIILSLRWLDRYVQYAILDRLVLFSKNLSWTHKNRPRVDQIEAPDPIDAINSRVD